MAKLRVSWRDLLYLKRTTFPALRQQWPLAKVQLERLVAESPEVAALYRTLEDAYRRLTT